MGLSELFTDITIYSLFLLYEVYGFFVTILAWAFLPITKWYLHRKARAVGIEINGKRKTDIRFLTDKAYVRIAKDWSLGLAEAYADKQVEMDDMLGTLCTMWKSRRGKEIEHPLNFIFRWFNLQTPRKAWEVGVEHYDLSPDLWEPMFGEHMQYSCGYWKDAKNLKEAQENKLHLIAKKLRLKPGMKLLDIGSGWGGLAKFMAKNYGVSVVGYTISKVQKQYCDKNCAGLPVEIRVADYRTINEKFDAIVSVGMFEHVGGRNYSDYFKTANRALKDNGLFLLHTMGISHWTTPQNDLFIHKYIFKNGYFPHHTEIAKSVEELFVIEDWHNMGYHYYLTYKAWMENLEGPDGWPKLEGRYGEKFRRIWTAYLYLFMALWKTRAGQLWQIVLSKDGLEGGYDSVR